MSGPSIDTAAGNHFSCSLTAVLLARVQAFGGDEAVAELLLRARSPRTVAYLTDLSNWISFDEANALWAAGGQVTHHPEFARAVGLDAAKRLNASPVAALLRSLGSVEQVYRQIALTATKFQVVTTMEAVDIGPGYAEVDAETARGFPRSADHCAWTTGLLSVTPELFGLGTAVVGHVQCQALGAPRCRYSIRWDHETEEARREAGSEDASGSGLRQQLEAMQERLRSMFATASDLIGADDIGEVLARITDRAAVEVRAPRYLLAVRNGAHGRLHIHQRGLLPTDVSTVAERILSEHPASLPESWLVVPVQSRRADYGRLLAMSEPGSRFFPQERELFAVYAQYAASALDSSAALVEARHRYDQSSALLELARALASAGTSDEVARRLAEAVPKVVDCDRVAVFVWDAGARQLRLRAATDGQRLAGELDDERWTSTLTDAPLVGQLLAQPSSAAIFVDSDSDSADPALHELACRVGAQAAVAVPLATGDALLGMLAVWVTEGAERLAATPDLSDRLSGVAAQATSALQNGHLVDHITRQALHDPLTGLANRLRFAENLRSEIAGARAAKRLAQLFYIDLDGFKPVNDEHGHEMGDRLLVAVAERLRGCTRGGDTVARLGGDEFAVLIDSRGQQPQGEALRRRLAEAIERPFEIGGLTLTLGASIGRAVFPLDGHDAESLLRAADATMFAEKRARHAATPGGGHRA